MTSAFALQAAAAFLQAIFNAHTFFVARRLEPSASRTVLLWLSAVLMVLLPVSGVAAGVLALRGL